MKYIISTLGCKVNQYESQSVREAWQRMDGAETDAPAGALPPVFPAVWAAPQPPRIRHRQK